ncbi:hypothetical protein TARUN_6007 [Trichoderma arundinaceum]|uniref:UBC core domain-containing protein n=1 Tax=Trichoderma arundinaceum TaxID=490622 RepID=A0A395NK16_TRIAR|nr:hypothetical protein TARUN_6007 [Trichoderma arundinaceum]
MGSKQFNQDLGASKAIEIDGVSDVRRGDSDGEVVFSWSPKHAAAALDIRVLVLDVDSYPKSSSVMVFTESDYSMIDDVSSFLERLSTSLGNKNIQAIIKTVAEKLLAKLESSSDSCEIADSDGTLDSDDYDEVESAYDDGMDDDVFLHGTPKPISYEHVEPSLSFKRLKKDLQTAQSAGFSVGVFPRRPVRDAEFFSLSLRVAKLGIPEHALEAWDLRDDEYVVLLCRFPSHYPTISEILDTSFDEWKPHFRFGKCARPKPSIETARFAFTVSADGSSGNKVTYSGKSEAKGAGDDLVPLYMTNSINMLMNGEFLKLLKTRRRDGVSWDEALNRQKLLAKGGQHDLQHADLSNLSASNTPVSETAMPSLSHDYALDDERDFSLPMVAMQFALRRLVRCTKYCMICHQKVEDGFEALKPYVCSSPLCTYQFVSLGLGASIEHEIINNPYVVDILVSFFAAALAYPNALRQYPTGLNLKGVSAGTKTWPGEHFAAHAQFLVKTIRFDPDDAKYREIKVGDSILVVVEGTEDAFSNSILNGTFERHVCKVTMIIANHYFFEVLATLTTPINVQSLPESERPTQMSNTKEEWVRVWVFQYNCDIDNINASDRAVALTMIMRGIPSVLDMRAYLLNNPSQRLASWGRMDKNSLTLLQWIISSNRSLILQDDAVPNLIDPPKKDSDNSEATTPSNPNKVQGMSREWMQFRFLQGTPEREGLFMKELMAVSQSGSTESQFPTIFAWHGSGIHNWHSIIRTGLDFETVQNGRSYGDGVYMSNEFSTSLSYCRKSILAARKQPGQTPESFWPNSQLKPGGAITICEVVNQWDKFVKVEPHYVVNKIEWIQSLQQPFPVKPREVCAGYITQCPSRELHGKQGKTVQIPLSALPSNRRHLSQNSGTGDDTEPPESPKSPALSLESDHGETDHELLWDSDDEDVDIVMARSSKHRSSSIDSLSMRHSKLSSAAYAQKMPDENKVVRFRTDFVPGSLDLRSLPRLPEPSWATTSPLALRSLNRAIKELYQTQCNEDVDSLGWYIDFDNLTNVFHWIVELHSFELELPLAQDMKKKDCTSIVLEFRFGANFPYAPPFVRVIRPRFLPFAQGGGGHVTAGGAICSEMLTNSGWSAVMTIEKILLQIRLGLTELDPPARLDKTYGMNNTRDYSIGEAVDAYQRAARAHGWQIPDDLKNVGYGWISKD